MPMTKGQNPLSLGSLLRHTYIQTATDTVGEYCIVPSTAASCRRGCLFGEGHADEVCNNGTGLDVRGDGLDHSGGGRRSVPECTEGKNGVSHAAVDGGRCRRGEGIKRCGGIEFIAQLNDDALGGLLANAGDGGNALDVAAGNGVFKLMHRQAGKGTDGKPGTDTADGEQVHEHVALVPGAKAVKLLIGCGNVVVDEQTTGSARLGELVIAAERYGHFVTYTADVEDDACQLFYFQPAFKKRNHSWAICRIWAGKYSFSLGNANQQTLTS